MQTALDRIHEIAYPVPINGRCLQTSIAVRKDADGTGPCIGKVFAEKSKVFLRPTQCFRRQEAIRNTTFFTMFTNAGSAREGRGFVDKTHAAEYKDR